MLHLQVEDDTKIVSDWVSLEATFCLPQNCFRTRHLTLIHTFLHLRTSLLYF